MKPKVPLEAGLRRTIDYFDRLLKEGSHSTLKTLKPVAVSK